MSSDKAGGKRLGRPPSPPGTARNHRVVTFVNDSEFELLNRICKKTGAPLSTTVYQLLSTCLADQQKSNTDSTS